MDPIAASLIAFLLAAGLLTITPGMDTALVLRTASSEGPRRALLAAAGISTGCLIWATLTAFGLGALLAVSALAYTALKWAGAAYLVWLGYKMLRHPRRSFLVEGQAANRGGAFVKGALTNLLNPKIGVFYVSFLPQFVPHSVMVAPYIVMLGAVHAGLGLIWMTTLLLATRPLMRFLRAPAVIQALDRVTGGVFILFGVGLALESRRT
jgi:threonine/homoserine/homoserine lactone efflux protein